MCLIEPKIVVSVAVDVDVADVAAVDTNVPPPSST